MADASRPEQGPAAAYTRIHQPMQNINETMEAHRTLGQRVADDMTNLIGSWPFILGQSVLMLAWIGLNVYLAVQFHAHRSPLDAWDPYPFILLNLALSFQSAYAGSIVLMSQNRQSQRDRLRAEEDYRVNLRAEQEIGIIIQQLVYNNHLHREALPLIEAMERQLAELAARCAPEHGQSG